MEIREGKGQSRPAFRKLVIMCEFQGRRCPSDGSAHRSFRRLCRKFCGDGTLESQNKMELLPEVFRQGDRAGIVEAASTSTSRAVQKAVIRGGTIHAVRALVANASVSQDPQIAALAQKRLDELEAQKLASQAKRNASNAARRAGVKGGVKVEPVAVKEEAPEKLELVAASKAADQALGAAELRRDELADARDESPEDQQLALAYRAAEAEARVAEEVYLAAEAKLREANSRPAPVAPVAVAAVAEAPKVPTSEAPKRKRSALVGLTEAGTLSEMEATAAALAAAEERLVEPAGTLAEAAAKQRDHVRAGMKRGAGQEAPNQEGAAALKRAHIHAIQNHSAARSDVEAAKELAAVAELKFNHVRGLNEQPRERVKVLIKKHEAQAEKNLAYAAESRAMLAKAQEAEVKAAMPVVGLTPYVETVITPPRAEAQTPAEEQAVLASRPERSAAVSAQRTAWERHEEFEAKAAKASRSHARSLTSMKAAGTEGTPANRAKLALRAREMEVAELEHRAAVADRAGADAARQAVDSRQAWTPGTPAARKAGKRDQARNQEESFAYAKELEELTVPFYKAQATELWAQAAALKASPEVVALEAKASTPKTVAPIAVKKLRVRKPKPLPTMAARPARPAKLDASPKPARAQKATDPKAGVQANETKRVAAPVRSSLAYPAAPTGIIGRKFAEKIAEANAAIRVSEKARMKALAEAYEKSLA
jgi:hypothetical protein